MILYLLTWRPSSAGDGTETLSFWYWCGDLRSGECDDCCPWYSSNDFHFSNCSSLLHAIIQQNKDADFVSGSEVFAWKGCMSILESEFQGM